MHHETITEMLKAWDDGETIWSVELGGLGPGYEQAIQVAAIEFARAGKDMPRTEDDEKDTHAFDVLCSKRLKALDDSLGGLSGAQYSAAKWLAWQWCFNGGPKRLQERARIEGKEDDTIQVSNTWPRVNKQA